MDEIERYTRLGRGKSVITDISRVKLFPNFIGLITILADRAVLINFTGFSFDEPFLRFRGKYPTIGLMISDLEIYLDKSIDQWENFNKTGNYPKVLVEDTESIQDDKDFLKTIELPLRGRFEKL
jgi:predicted AAA+ superfamily ATPase